MRKKPLLLPEGYKHKNISSFFIKKTLTPPPNSNQQPLLNISANQSTTTSAQSTTNVNNPILQTTSCSQTSTDDIIGNVNNWVSDDVSSEEEDNLPVFKRLRPNNRLVQNANHLDDSSISSINSANSDIDLDAIDEPIDDFNQLDENDEPDNEQRAQIATNTWLMKALRTLKPLSEPVDETLPEEQQFLRLKKQWGYTQSYESVDPDDNDCPLCEHKHVATLFSIKNRFNKATTDAASHCITQFRVLNDDNTLMDKATSKGIIKADIEEANKERQKERQAYNKFIIR
jgi:hypothetical protein